MIPIRPRRRSNWGGMAVSFAGDNRSTTAGARGNVTERERIARVLTMIDDWIGPQGVPAASAAVWRRGELVATHAAGEATPGNPADDETIFALASVTKPVTAAVVMSLVEEGAISLDESAVRFVPEFGSGPL